MNRSKWQIGLALAFSILLVAGVAVAQEDTGNCYVVVSDATGARLPGATVTLSGYGAPRVQVSNANGEVRFLNLDPGSFQLAAELDGFSSVEYPAVDVRVGRSTTIEVTLSEAVEETITVTSESPLLDERRISTGTTVSQVELEKIPTARDPWSILSQTPGVMVDRINVGGNESGQQSAFNAPGVTSDENAFLIDGVETTDMAATGASATYYDFDQFTEMQFTTGGSDVTKVNAGVSVNLVTKRGTNEFRGSARFMRTDDNFFNGALEQNVPEASAGDLGPNQSGFVGNTINKVTEYGFEAGGPVVKDKFWAWGSFGSNDIKNRTGAATVDAVQADDTILENTAVKLNAQFSASNSATGSWNNGDKNKFGRNASPTRPAPTTWDQRGPSAIIKFEDSHVFNSNFFLTGTYSIVDGGFSLTCKACLNGLTSAPETVLDLSTGVWNRSFLSGPSARPSDEVHADGSYFFNAGTTSHEVKFGARKRHFETSSAFHWPGRDIFYLSFGAPEAGADMIGVAHRGETPLVSNDYTSAWVQDTLTAGNLTANFGLRYDLQEGANEAFAVPGNPGLPDILPGLSITGGSADFDFTSILPRAGITYAVGADKDVLLRASFSQFAEQLGSGNISRVNPLGDVYQYFYFTDSNGNWQWDPEEAYELGYSSGFDPDNPTSLDDPDVTASNLDPAITSELILGAEWAVLPEFVVGAQITYRDTTDVSGTRAIITDGNGVTRPVGASDYQPVTVSVDPRGVPGIPTSATLWELKDGLSLTGGSLLENTDRNIVYQGVNVNFIKRLSNRWMARGYFNTGDAEWNVGSGYTSTHDPTVGISGDVDGDLFVEQAAGSGAKADVFLQSTWQANVNGLYQVAPDKPWGFNIAGNVFMRSGTPLPYFTNPIIDGTRKTVRLTDAVDTFRTPSVTSVDLRLEKEFASTSNVGFTFSLDAFNIFDETTVLQRERNLRLGSGDNLRETLSPRIYRFGVRMSWR
jgi:hypothetical protein